MTYAMPKPIIMMQVNLAKSAENRTLYTIVVYEIIS